VIFHSTVSDRMLVDELNKIVQAQKAKHRWLTGGIVFVDSIPKSPAGMILRRLLRDQERQKQEPKAAKL
jgi:4-coumarate--CoA ligase